MSTKVSPAMGSLGAKQKSRKRSVFADLLSPISNKLVGGSGSSSMSLPADKFQMLMTFQIASFQENGRCFKELSNKLKELLDVKDARIMLVDTDFYHLYTFTLNEVDGSETKIHRPMDRGLTSAVISSGEGLVVDSPGTDARWDRSVDEIDNFSTTNYIAWPLLSLEGEVIGMVEGRNKGFQRGGSSSSSAARETTPFTTMDEQMIHIFAHQMAAAISASHVQGLLADRDDAMKKVYQKDGDNADAIRLEAEGDRNNNNNNNGSPRILANPDEQGTLLRAEMTARLQNWGYDVVSKTVDELLLLFHDVFESRGLFERFSVSRSTFTSFSKAVVAGYNTSPPYHNYFHGFDVMHVCYLLVSTTEAEGYLDEFNVLSLLVAAIAHDVGHDGYNNAFHATTMTELAITYNSVSIMENFSAAFLFRILKLKECNILARLSSEDLKKMRGRLIDMILDTDAKNHFLLITRFKHGLDMKQLSRGLLSSMLLHIADVSNPTRPGNISRTWAFFVQEEFFRQGDTEKKLGMPVSPFMDRDYENLPRMQGAFIDALVSPIFALLAEFLPKVKVTCIKSLQINRAFWNSLQQKQILKTPDIKAYLANEAAGIIHNKSPNHGVPLVPGDEGIATIPGLPVAAGSSSPRSHDSELGAAIPGIPQNAGGSSRKMSIIAMRSNAEELEKLREAHTPVAEKESLLTLLSPRSKAKATVESREKVRKRVFALLDDNRTQLVMLISTTYALFSSDLSLWIGDMSADKGVSIITLIVFISFCIELVFSVYCVPEYLQFFFWLDSVAALSLVPEFSNLFVAEMKADSSKATAAGGLSSQATLTRAGRAAKAGARAGRVARVLRLVRLVRIVKLIKWASNFWRKKHEKDAAHVDDADDGEEVDMKMSIVGRKMTESITRKVILAVMFMLLVFSLSTSTTTPDARQLQLDLIAEQVHDHDTMMILKEDYLSNYDKKLVMLRGVGDLVWDSEHYDSLRFVELSAILATKNTSIVAFFDVKEDSQAASMQSFIMTIVVTVLLGVLSMAFSRDAYRIMIRPIEKMKRTVQQLSENPLLHLEKLKNAATGNAESETDMLEQAITKMARLLQIGFGSAGAEIIAKNLSDGGELNPMIPGQKVDGIFGFCDIRDFTFATEGLQQDVMLFVNKIADITHKYVVESGGAPNKNIGDAFLLVWKLNSSEKNGRGTLQKELFDSSLFAFLRIIREINRLGTLSAFLEGADANAAWRNSLEDFQVKMGFGLHTGWAIEGSIGSAVKVDASYLSPHVNLASRLEAATKQFRVPLLMSEAFVKGLTGATQSSCRKVDRVTFKGSSDPMNVYHFDSEQFSAMTERSTTTETLLESCKWTDDDVIHSNLNMDEIYENLHSKKDSIVRQVYESAFLAYVDGDWLKAKILLGLWVTKFPIDQPGVVLLENICSQDFTPPKPWLGYRALTEK